MVRPIMKDRFFLSQKSKPATSEDISVAQDLLDTLAAHRDGCVGMAANMIGVAKRIIVFTHDGSDMVMFNPEIIKQTGPYETEEGCLSLTGVRPTTRYRTITVRYQNAAFQSKQRTFHDWSAQIIQHEIDHCNGIII
jgi:peptide deformylase